MNPIDIIGCNGPDRSETVQRLLAGADLIAGSRRLLAELPPEIGAERRELDGTLAGAIPDLVHAAECRHVVILASGDPLCCGIGGTLRRLAPKAPLRFHPAPTAFQTLAAKLGLPWEKLQFFPLHGRPSALPWRRILRASGAILYGDAHRSAPRIAAQLVEKFPAAADRFGAIGCDLNLEGEKIVTGRLAELAAAPELDRSLSILILFPEEALSAPELPLGLNDDNYLHHKNMITHPEVRAIVLSKLRLRPGVLWDLGAGSGSVGIEAAGLCGGLAVHLVDRNPERLAEAIANIGKEGLDTVTPHTGDALELLEQLPSPDRIFVGGGGKSLKSLLNKAFKQLKPGGIMVAGAVLVESVATLSTELADHRIELLSINISRSEPLGVANCWKAENPIVIAVYRKPEESTP